METLASSLPPSPVLRADDVTLRRHRLDDLDCVFDQCQDQEMQWWTTIPVPYTLADAEKFLQDVAEAWDEGRKASFAIDVGTRFAGSVDLRFQEGAWAEVGYGIAPWACGRQVMTRALGLVLLWGFRDLGLRGVQWRAKVGNHASLRVAEKCGFRIEGTVRGLLFHRGQRVDGWIGTVLSDECRQ